MISSPELVFIYRYFFFTLITAEQTQPPAVTESSVRNLVSGP